MKTPAPTPPALTEPTAQPGNDAKTPILLKGIDSLLEVVRKPHVVTLELGAQRVKIEVRALNEVEWASVRAIGADVKAPPKYKDAAKKEQDGFNEEDPTYVAAVTEAFDQRKTMTLSLGLVGMDIPGDTLEAKHEWRKKNLPPQVTDALWAAIKAVTADPVSLGYFTTGAS